MNNAALITLLKKGRRDSLADTESAIYNLFVQILLPLILVLCFVAIIDILTYKNAFWIIFEENNQLIEEGERVKLTDKGKEIKRANTLILKLQKLRLLMALEEIKPKEQERFKLIFFWDDKSNVSGNKVQLRGANINDNNFKLLCNSFKIDVYGKRQSYQDRLYEHILIKAEMIDDGSGSKEAPHEYIITSENRTFISGEIKAFTDSLETDVVTLQSEVLIRIIDALMAEHKTLDKSSQQLVAEILNPKTGKTRRQRAVKAFYDLQVKQIKIKLGKKYAFLDRTWHKIESIQFSN